MRDDAASLDRLHDIVLPPAVPWWPPAPGWIVLAVIVLLLLLWLAVRLRRRWQRTAHRREALRALRDAGDAGAVGALLRRTALAEYPREQIAALRGSAWVDWLAEQDPAALPAGLREQLVQGVYAPSPRFDPALREWAARWISARAVPKR
jgi:hypothetical protein